MQQLSKVLIALAVVAGAFLMFQIEPVAGKIVTARFGGTASVWCLLLVFFQTVLLVGYCLTYQLTKLPPRRQTLSYVVLIAAALVLTGCSRAMPWEPSNVSLPQLSLLLVLTIHLAAPCVWLSTVSGVMQVWFKRLTGGDPYFLYSLSNAGSLLALLSYTPLVEPYWSTSATQDCWQAALLVLAALCCGIACLIWRCASGSSNEVAQAPVRDAAFSAKAVAWWILLSALGSALLLTVTNYITQDIAPVPLLWIPPLALYLITFIVAFAGERWYKRGLILPLTLLACACFPLLDFVLQQVPLVGKLALCAAFLFFGCFMCNGELYRSRPSVKNLPAFYFAIALGGVIGGVAISIVAPLTVNIFIERLLVLLIVILVASRLALQSTAVRSGAVPAVVAINVCLIALAAVSVLSACGLEHYHTRNVLWQPRNFYGSAAVIKGPGVIVLYHSTTLHGSQYQDPQRRQEVASYYRSAMRLVDTALRSCHSAPLSYGVIGLGAGSLAVFGKPGDTINFYELDPKIEDIARRYFTFVKDSPANVNVVMGDARASLAHEAPRNYDLLVVDAFNGDSIPVHLLTSEALHIYRTQINANGALLFHITNHYLDLAPVLATSARQLGMTPILLEQGGGKIRYVLLTANQDLIRAVTTLAGKPPLLVRVSLIEADPLARPWTDDFSNLFSVLGRR